MKKSNHQSNWGGRRKGAGRPKGTFRPSSPDSRTQMIYARLSPNELSRVITDARAKKLSKSSYIRVKLGLEP